MKCITCLKEFDFLFNCPDCAGRDISYCQEHRYSHKHISDDEYVNRILEENGFREDKVYQKLWKALGSSSYKLPEWIHLLIGILFLFYGFVISPIIQGDYKLNAGITDLMIISIAFLSHVFVQKIFAHKSGFYSRFAISQIMIVIILIAGLVSIPIAVVGTVIVFGELTEENHGKIAMVGPMTNLVLAGFGMVSYLIFRNLPILILQIPLLEIIERFVIINLFWSGFNLIPISYFDGWKIFNWKPSWWLVLYVLTIALFFLFIFSF